jgi:glucan endo-1,3-alpha-glucosidase
MWALAVTSQPSTVVLTTAAGTSKSFDVPAGVNKLSLALSPGAGMSGTITRGGQTVASVTADKYKFDPNPPNINFNVFIAEST